MPSLLEALEEKYGRKYVSDLENNEELVSIYVPKLPARMTVPELLVLNDCNIDRAGESEDLRKKCSTVRELDLAQNKLERWEEIFRILSHMPRVEFVNLSLNRLYKPIAPPACDIKMDRLRSLVLNNTHLEWPSVEMLLRMLPSLEELHLSLNDYKNVLLDTHVEEEDYGSVAVELDNEEHEADVDEELNNNDEAACECQPQKVKRCQRSESTCSQYKKTDAHEGVRKLHFTGNPVTDWVEICRLGRVFPSLESLVLADCPIRSLDAPPLSPTLTAVVQLETQASTSADLNSNNAQPQTEGAAEANHAHFKNLTFLNLSNSAISTWDDIDRLAKFPKLRNLRVRKWPLWEKCDSTEHERRQLLIARLPYVTTLNGGGEITREEREDAERAFVRYYMDKPESDRPARFDELSSLHGKLDPLVNIDLRPEKRVKVRFTYGDHSEERSVDVYRTVFDLKTRLEKLIKVPAAKLRLYYVDQDLRDHMGPEEMRFSQKQLYSYNIRSGDEIIVERKG